MIPIRDHKPSGIFPVVTVSIIAINVVVFLYEFMLMSSGAIDPFLDKWAIIPAQLVHNPLGEGITIFSAMFLHGGWAHLLGNMLYLWIFGDNLEAQLGSGPYLVFYLAGGVAATLAQVAIAPSSTVPNLGASGAIAAVLGGYLALWPSARVDVLVPSFGFLRRATVSVLLALGLWIAYQVLLGVTSIGAMADGSGGVAYFAHIGGFAMGFVIMTIYKGIRRGPVIRG